MRTNSFCATGCCGRRETREAGLVRRTRGDALLFDHPILANRLDDVQLTLTDPNIVNYDETRLDVENFYRWLKPPAPVGWVHLKVCVRFNAVPGSVLTAFPTLLVKQVEMRKWP